MSQYLYSVVIVTVLILNNVTIFEKHCMKGTNKPMSQQPIWGLLHKIVRFETYLPFILGRYV